MPSSSITTRKRKKTRRLALKKRGPTTNRNKQTTQPGSLSPPLPHPPLPCLSLPHLHDRYCSFCQSARLVDVSSARFVIYTLDPPPPPLRRCVIVPCLTSVGIFLECSTLLEIPRLFSTTAVEIFLGYSAVCLQPPQPRAVITNTPHPNNIGFD